jgi:hypothetical protein
MSSQEFKCSNCHKLFTSKRNLNYHLNKNIPCTSQLKCNICGKKFNTNQHLNNHKNRINSCVFDIIPPDILYNKIKILETTITDKNQEIQSLTNDLEYKDNRINMLEKKMERNYLLFDKLLNHNNNSLYTPDHYLLVIMKLYFNTSKFKHRFLTMLDDISINSYSRVYRLITNTFDRCTFSDNEEDVHKAITLTKLFINYKNSLQTRKDNGVHRIHNKKTTNVILKLRSVRFDELIELSIKYDPGVVIDINSTTN